MKLTKKILAITLSVLMIVSFVPMAAFANEAFTTKGSADVNVDDAYIYGLDAEGSTLKDVQDQVVEALSAADKDGNALADTAYIGTGATVTAGTVTVTAVLFGDVNGDGAIDGFDLFLVNKDINDIAKLSGVFAFAGDTDDDGAVDIDDYNAIRAQIAGEELVNQRTALPTVSIVEADASAIGAVDTYSTDESITPDAAFDLEVNQTAADIAEKDYADWTADFVLTFNKAVNAEDVYLFGNYGAYGWMGNNLEPVYSGSLAAGTEIKIISEWLASVEPAAGAIPYSYVVANVADFASAIFVKNASDGLTATVKFVLTDGDGVAHEIDSFEYTWTVLPTATINEADASAIGAIDTYSTSESITPDAAFDLNTDETAAEAADATYADWTVDFVLTFNKAVNAEDVYLFGNYGAYGWMGNNLEPVYTGSLAAGTEIKIVSEWLASVEPAAGAIPYSYVVANVENFKSAIYVKDAADGLVATVKLIMTDGDGVAHDIDTFEYTWTVLPTHNFTEVPTNTVGNNGVVTGIVTGNDIAVDTAVELTTDLTAADIADKNYKDWVIDFKLTFNKDVSSDDVYIFGNYGPYNWVGDAIKYIDGGVGATLAAGDPIRLLGDSVNYKDLATIQDFKCAIYVNNPVDGLKATLELIMVDPDDTEYVLDTYTYTWVVPVLPTVEIVDGSTVGEIFTGSETVTPDVAVEIDFNETYAEVLDKEYADYATDVIVTFNKTLNADDVYFFGKYGTSGWLGGALSGMTIDADNPFSLVDWYLAGTSYAGQDLPYKEVLKRVSGGEAALFVDGDTTGLVVTVKIVITDENGVETVLKEDSYEYIAKPNVDIVEPEVVIPGGEIPYGTETIEPDTAVVVSFNESYDDIQDKEYKNWTADIVVTFNKDLNAQDVYFFGQYGGSGWLGGSLEGQTINANQAISLVNWFLGGTSYSPSDVTYEEVLKRITTDARAALYIEDAAAKAGLVITVQMVLTDEDGNKKVLEEGKYEYIAAPTFEIVDGSSVGTIAYGDETITPDTAVNVTFTETYADVQDKEYKDWKADVVVMFNKALDSDKVFFFGKYGSSAWLGGNLTTETITANTPISLAGWFLNGSSHTPDDVTYEEVLKRITSGGQGALYITDNTDGLIVTAQIVLTDDDGNKKVIAEDKYAYIPEPAVDIYTPAEVAAIGEIPYESDMIEPDTAVKVEFAETYADVQDKEYKDWTADIVVTFNKDLNAEDVCFFGQFGGSGWLGGALTGETITAGNAISLVNWFLGNTSYSPSDVTYEEVLKRITTDANAALYIKDAAAKAGLVVNVQMVLNDGEGHTMVLAEDSYAY